MNNHTKATNDKLWLDEEFRRLYPLSAQHLEDLAEQQREDLVYRHYIETLRGLQAVGKLSEKEALELEFNLKDCQVQSRSTWVAHQKDDD
jgi:hypothetical protein